MKLRRAARFAAAVAAGIALLLLHQVAPELAAALSRAAIAVALIALLAFPIVTAYRLVAVRNQRRRRTGTVQPGAGAGAGLGLKRPRSLSPYWARQMARMERLRRRWRD